jgi:hypothetical protein
MIQLDELSDAILDAMRTYTAEVEEAVPEIVDETAKEIVNQIRAAAPKRTGGYAKGWTARKLGSKLRSADGYAKVVCNPKKYYLAHLLEYGHAKRGGGRVAGKPHIGPACDRLLPEFEERLKRAVKR